MKINVKGVLYIFEFLELSTTRFFSTQCSTSDGGMGHPSAASEMKRKVLKPDVPDANTERLA